MQLNFCKSCGGDIERRENHFVCKYCGNKWMIDIADDIHAVDRANAWSALRFCDFERAVELFENIIFKEPENHEAYWGRALASAGIMYVTDLDEHKKVPTCNSISDFSFIDSKDVQKAITLAPDELSAAYKNQAEMIESIRIEWLKKARKEKPYDVFICFKDSDREHNIERTDDSYDAHELYNALTAEGYRVFFSRVSLRDKVSEHYEPYIFNALKTAKVMIVFGEKPEYFNAVWVKNEWNRFRERVKRGEKHPNSLIVVYKNMDPADLPAGLRSIQCLNANEITFFENLKKHISRIVDNRDEPVVVTSSQSKPKVQTINKSSNNTISIKSKSKKFLAIIATSIIFVLITSLLIVFGISQTSVEMESETTQYYEQTTIESITESDSVSENIQEITTTSESEIPENTIGDPGDYSYDNRNEIVYICNSHSAIMLRDENYNNKGTLMHGTKITRIGISADTLNYWSKIEYEGNIYYVASKFLTNINPIDLDNGFVKIQKTISINENFVSLNIRELPTIDSNIIGFIMSGEEISVIAVNEETGWYKIEFINASEEKATGYIISDEKYYN